MHLPCSRTCPWRRGPASEPFILYAHTYTYHDAYMHHDVDRDRSRSSRSSHACDAGGTYTWTPLLNANVIQLLQFTMMSPPRCSHSCSHMHVVQPVYRSLSPAAADRAIRRAAAPWRATRPREGPPFMHKQPLTLAPSSTSTLLRAHPVTNRGARPRELLALNRTARHVD